MLTGNNQLKNTANCPIVPKGLLLYLNATYREHNISSDSDVHEIFFRAGQRDVIKKLNYFYSQQVGESIDRDLITYIKSKT